MSRVMRKPVSALCEQQRRRSACASTQSDQHLCCLLPRQYNTSTCCSRNFKTVASLCSWAGRFDSYQVANPEDRFSRDVDHIFLWTTVENYSFSSESYAPISVFPQAVGAGIPWGSDSQNRHCPREFDRSLWHRGRTLDVSVRKSRRNYV